MGGSSLRGDLRRVWYIASKSVAEAFLEGWCDEADSSGIRVLVTLSHTRRAYRSGILTWYECRISTGPLEGTNPKIRVLQRQAYGFSDTEFFKLKIMVLHERKYALVG